MPYNAILKDEQTGEMIKLRFVISERLRFPNTITSEPIDIGKTGGRFNSRVLADNIKHLPMVLDVTLDLQGDPGGSGFGGEGYELEQHQKLVAMSNRDTTFTYTSFLYTKQTPTSETTVAGMPIEFLGMANYEALKGGNKGINIIGGRLRFQSVVVSFGGELIQDPDVAYGAHETALREADLTGQGIIGTTLALLAAAIAVALSAPLWGVAAAVAAGYAVGSWAVQGIQSAGEVPIATGSLPRQIHRMVLGTNEFEVELRANIEHELVTFSLKYRDTYVVQERVLRYAQNILYGITHSSVAGLSIVPLCYSDTVHEVTPDTLGKTVQLVVLEAQEAGA